MLKKIIKRARTTPEDERSELEREVMVLVEALDSCNTDWDCFDYELVLRAKKFLQQKQRKIK